MSVKIDVEKIRRAARHSIPVSVTSYKLSYDTENYLEGILSIFLDDFGQKEIAGQVGYCLKELAVNAKKSNTKRVYFLEKGLQINNLEDYEQGMANFKQETLDNIDYYLEKQKSMGLYVKVIFHVHGETLILSVRNNAEITKGEQIRVYDRIARSRAFDTMEEAFSTVLDDSEGAGLGLVILVLMLKKIGLDEDAFDLDVENGETVTKIKIPFSSVHKESLEELSQAIVDEIDELPQFPENIVHLQGLINDPDSEITNIARQISMDPSLTADLLKIVNSAQFMLAKRVDNIVGAVKLVGLRLLRNLLYSYGTQLLMKSNQKWLWEHSHRTAFFAYYLSKKYKMKRDILDDAYVGGILHDMGKIIFAQIHPHLLERIVNFCKERDIKRNFLEDLSAGLNHAEIGARIAAKWNFPDSLVAAIKYHHEPLEAPQEFKDIVETVYLANALCNYDKKTITYEQLESKVLNNFGITSEEQFILILKKLTDAFEKEREGNQTS